MADLKQCPFCGEEAMVRHYEDIKMDFSSSYLHYGECTKCKAQSGWKSNVEEAIIAWNTRKPMEAVVAELEKEKSGLTTWAEDEAFKLGIDTAISIVRGKE